VGVRNICWDLPQQKLLIKESHMSKKLPIVFFLVLSLSACVSTNPKNDSASTGQSSSQSNEKEMSKAEKKISLAIGREIEDFKITGHKNGDAPTGYNETIYDVKTKDGSTYKCSILEPSGLGKAILLGMSSGSGAMCTDFTKNSKQRGKTNAPSCNELLRAAGKC
jgi:hypothetical protein